jgi:predicted enzyme related to lactoylglutathione lyase
MAGAIAGALDGAAATPKRWLEALEDGEKGRSHIERLAEGARVLNSPPSAADGRRAAIVLAVPGARLSLIEFPADDPERARRFWAALLGTALEPRHEGEGWQTHSATQPVGVHARGRGPGDSFSLPYFAVDDLAEALEQVEALGGSVVHPGSAWAVCKDSEGSPFGLALMARG